MKTLYLVEITYEGMAEVPVYAASEIEAKNIAHSNSCLIDDCDLDTTFRAYPLRTVPGYIENDIPEGEKHGRTCGQIIDELNQKKQEYEILESLPKLPGFE